MMTGHDGPFFRPDNMRDAGHVPADDVVVADGPVLCRPLFYPIIDFITGRVVAGGVFFSILVLSDPELVIEEASLFTQDGTRGCKRRRLPAGHEHITRMLPQRIVDRVVHNMPA